MARGQKKEKKELTPEERLQNALVPKEEWPYELPEGWKWVKLAGVSEVIMGQSPAGDDTTDDSSYMPLIGGAADMGELYPHTTRYTKRPTKVSKNDDLILCIRATLGRPIFSDGNYCLGRGVAGIRTYSKEILPSYLRYFFMSNEQYLYENATGSTFLQVTGKVLQSMPVPIPKLIIQKQIVDILDKEFQRLDEAKDQIQSVLDSSEDRKQSILHKAFAGELTEKWRKKNSKEKKWTFKCLDEVCSSIFDGDHMSPPKADSGIPFIVISFGYS